MDHRVRVKDTKDRGRDFLTFPLSIDARDEEIEKLGKEKKEK